MSDTKEEKSEPPKRAVCPFCGEDDTVIGWRAKPSNQFYVLCCCCEAMGPESQTRNGAARLWNSR